MVLEEEDLVDAILLERAELDKKANRSSKRLFDDEALLASDLVGGFGQYRVWLMMDGIDDRLTASRSWSKSLRALSVMAWVSMAFAAGCAAITY